MRKFLPTVLLGGAMLLSAAPVLAAPASSWYGQAKLGVFVPNDESDGLKEFDNGPSLEVSFGRRINPNLALELGIGWYKTEWDDSDIDAEVSVVPVTATVKGILPLMNDRLDLFAGAGVGYYFAEAEVEGSDDSGSAFGYHLLVGADYKLTNAVAIGAEARWFWTEPEFDGEDIQVGGATYSLALKYSF